MLLHQAMDAAVQQRLVAKNPTNGTVIPKNNYAPKQILMESQLTAFLEVVKQDPVWSDFDESYFWIYNIAAEDEGYYACSKCH